MKVSGKVGVLVMLGLPIVFGVVWLDMMSTPESDPQLYHVGRDVTPAEIARIDIDVRPDGLGLPPGSGTVAAGKVVYADQCASCHGASGVEGPNDILVGHVDGDASTLANKEAVVHTIGSYWPYATTIFDYVRRAMPAMTPGSMSDDEVYAVTAHLLFLNGLIEEDQVIDAVSLPQVEMPAQNWYYSGYETRKEAPGGR
jgi:cytochrome c